MERISSNLIFPAILLAASFLLPADLLAARMVNISDRVKLYTPRLDQKYERLQLFLRAADGAVSSVSAPKSGEKGIPCSVIVSGNDLKEGFEISSAAGETRIFLTEDSATLEKDPKIQEMIISSMLLCRFGISPEGGSYAKVPAWMTAALINKIDRRKNNSLLLGVVTYCGVRALCISGNPPDLWRTVNFPLEPGDGPSYKLYSEACALLMDAIAKFPGNGRELFSSLLKYAMDDVKDASALKGVLEASIRKSGADIFIVPENGDGDMASDWFRMAARNSSISMFYPGTSDYAARRLGEIEKMECELAPSEARPAPEGEKKAAAEIPARPREDGNVKKEVSRTFKIEELGEKWQEIKSPEKTVISLQRRFSDLSNQLPSSLQDKVNGILVALKRLKDGRRDSFAGEYKDARTKFVEEVSRLKELEEYIRESERKFVPFGQAYSPELGFMDEAGSFAGRFWPDLDVELAREENRLR